MNNTETLTAQKILNAPGTPDVVKAALNKAITGQLLSPADRLALDVWKNSLPNTDKAVLNRVLQEDAEQQRLQGISNALTDLGGAGLVPAPDSGSAPVPGPGVVVVSDSSPGPMVVSDPSPVVVPVGGTAVAPGGGAAPSGSGESDGVTTAAAVKQTRRYLRVANQTEERLTVWVQYRAQTKAGAWNWYPADPSKSEAAVAYPLDPGAVVDLEHEGWKVNASRVRIWARSAGGAEWLDYKGEDLWLVPEIQGNEHCYYATALDTHTYTFSK